MGVIVKALISIAISLIYLLSWIFFGAILGGLNGVMWALVFGFLGITLTYALGDKCLLFILGARELTQKEKQITSLVSNFSCLKLYRPIKIYSFHHRDLQVCYVRSLVGQGSLMISDNFLLHPSSVELMEKVIAKSELDTNQITNVATMLSYQLTAIGYLLSPVSRVLSALVFYLFYPVVQMKRMIVSEKVYLGIGQLIHITNIEKRKTPVQKLAQDIMKDFSILERTDNDLLNYSLGNSSTRVSLE